MNTNKLAIIALAVAFLAAGFTFFSKTKVVEKITREVGGVGGASTFDEVITGGPGGVARQTVSLAMTTGVNQSCWANNTQNDSWVENVKVLFHNGTTTHGASYVVNAGVASSTLSQKTGAFNTLIDFGVDYGRPTTTFLGGINSVIIATDTPVPFVISATTQMASSTRVTSLGLVSVRQSNALDNYNPGDKAALPVTRVRPQERFCFVISNEDYRAITADRTPKAATSTTAMRGWDAIGIFDVFAATTTFNR